MFMEASHLYWLSRIDVITFDWGDTLARTHGLPHLQNHKSALGRLLNGYLCGTSLQSDPIAVEILSDKFIMLFNEKYHNSITFGHEDCNKEIDLNTMISIFLLDIPADKSFVSLEQKDSLIKNYYQDLLSIIVLRHDVKKTFQQLTELGYEIGIMSHTPVPGSACRKWFENAGLTEYISFYSFSSEVGWIKPDYRHFAHAEAHANCRRDRVLHVGDHPIRDIAGARNYGFHVALSETVGIYDSDLIAQCNPDFVFSTFENLLKHLGTFNKTKIKARKLGG